MQCSFCEQPAERACTRCGRFFCSAHGGDRIVVGTNAEGLQFETKVVCEGCAPARDQPAMQKAQRRALVAAIVAGIVVFLGATLWIGSGLTTGGSIGADTALKLEACPALVDKWAAAARRVRNDVIVLVHGGPVAQPDDAAFIMKTTELCQGFYGASSMERLPAEVALTEQTRKFKTIRGR